MNNKPIPDIIVSRLPKYLQALTDIQQKSNTTNSKELSEILGYSAAQIRKDLSQFGKFGKQGAGYKIDYLIDQLRAILNLNKKWKIILVGVGNIGRSIMRYPGFFDNCFQITAIVDNDPNIIGEQIGGCVIENTLDMERIIQEHDIKIAMITVPSANAQEIADKLIAAGIKSILSYAPVILNVPPDIIVEYIDPIISLQHITYYL